MGYNVEEVFVKSGEPQVTYVEPEEYGALLVAIRTKGMGVVIEGPSGIGKTTAVHKVLTNLKMEYRILSARKGADLNDIKNISEGEFSGIVIIDDFHRLPDEIRKKMSNVMKYLADEGDNDKKIIIIGINKVGDSLVHFSPDLNNRITTIKFEVNSPEKIKELIEKGEKALNIELSNKNKIIELAQGSFHIAQIICQKICIENQIYQTQEKYETINYSIDKIVNKLYDEFSRSYFKIVSGFATGPGLRREGRAPYLHILKWLAESKEWSINLKSEIYKHPEQKASVSQIIDKGYLKDFINKNDKISESIHFEEITSILSVEDPKLIFYLKGIDWENFAQDIGYVQLVSSPKYDFALSFTGQKREIAEKLFNITSEAELSVFYDKNEQHSILSENVEEYLEKIYKTEAMFVIPLLSQDYPTNIWTRFESKAFRERFGENAVIPVWFKENPQGIFEESRKYGGFELDEKNGIDEQLKNFADILKKKLEEVRIKKQTNDQL